MVEGINTNLGVTNYQMAKRPIVRPPKQDITNPITPNMMHGLESLGIYNMTLVKNKDNFNHPKLELIAPVDITPAKLIHQGVQEVKDPNGNVEYYTKNNTENGTITNYIPDETDKNKIRTIEIRDYQTGQKIKVQHNWNDQPWNGNCCGIEYYPLGEKNVSYFTRYEDGKLASTSKWIKDDFGNTKDYCIDYDDNNKAHYNIYIDGKNHSSLDVSLDENQRVNNVSNTIEHGNRTYTREVKLHNGAIIDVEEHQHISVHIPNYMETDVMRDKDLIPAKRFDKDEIAEKYANSPNLKYNGNGTVKKFTDGNIKVEFDGDNQAITEYIDKDTKRVTEYSKNDNSVFITYQKGNTAKSLCIENSKPKYYDEYLNNKNVKSLSFDDNGYLTQVY